MCRDRGPSPDVGVVQILEGRAKELGGFGGLRQTEPCSSAKVVLASP